MSITALVAIATAAVGIVETVAKAATKITIQNKIIQNHSL